MTTVPIAVGSPLRAIGSELQRQKCNSYKDSQRDRGGTSTRLIVCDVSRSIDGAAQRSHAWPVLF
jgi:hypothetical protein